MSDVLFEYKSTPSFGFFGKSRDESIVVFSDGSIVRRDFVFGQKEPSAENKIAFMPEITVLIEKVLIAHKEDMRKIPSDLNNGTFDGSHDCFQFGKKKISSWSIKRSDLNEVLEKNPAYYRQYKDNMVHENMVLDIYCEIVSILNGFELGIELKKK